jgi:hypothetical protein
MLDGSNRQVPPSAIEALDDLRIGLVDRLKSAFAGVTAVADQRRRSIIVLDHQRPRNCAALGCAVESAVTVCQTGEFRKAGDFSHCD